MICSEKLKDICRFYNQTIITEGQRNIFFRGTIKHFRKTNLTFRLTPPHPERGGVKILRIILQDILTLKL